MGVRLGFPAPHKPARIRLQNILFATDLTEASKSAEVYAASLTFLLGARLHVVHAAIPEDDQGRNTAAFSKYSELEKLRQFLKLANISFSVTMEPGQVKQVIQDLASRNSIDLIIVGTHARRGLSHLLKGSVAEGVMRSANCAVIAVGPKAVPRPNSRVQEILYATDFTPGSEAAMRYALSLAQEFPARFTALHVIPKLNRFTDNKQEEHQHFLAKLRNIIPAGECLWSSVDYKVSDGDPLEEIVSTAKECKADLIILGLHHSVEFQSRFAEHLSYEVICEAPCPILSVMNGEDELAMERMPFESLGQVMNMS